MDYIEKLLEYKKLDRRKILKSECMINEKIDGNAFQVVIDHSVGNMTYHKRPYSPNVIGPELNDIDFFSYPYYKDTKDYMESQKDIFLDIPADIVNFELLDSRTHHIIDNNETHKLYLLSAYKDGKEIDDITMISELLHIDTPQTYFNGILSDRFVDKLLDSDINVVYDLFHSEIDSGSVYHEGYVARFFTEERIRTYKIINPEFRRQITDRLQKEQSYKENKLEHIYKFVIDNTDINHIIIYARTHTYLQTLIYMYICLIRKSFLEKELSRIDNLIKIEKFCTSIHEIEINERYIYKLFDNVTELPFKNVLRFIIIGFRNVRSKNPLWCSLEFQNKEINTFIEKIGSFCQK